jgi:hypothetical protein
MRRPLLLSAALLLAACNTDVAPQFRVEDVRVLAVRAGVPSPGVSADVRAGDTLVLDGLVANPLGRPGLSIDWFACLPAASDAVSPCSDYTILSDPARLPGLASGPSPSVLFLGSGPSVQLTVPALTEALAFVIRKAQRQPTYACRLFAEIVVAVVASAEGRRSVAVKSVRVLPSDAQLAAAGVSSSTDLNNNPVIRPPGDGVFFSPAGDDGCEGGTPLGAAPLPAARTAICARYTSQGPDTFHFCPPDGAPERTEEDLSWQWYVTGGDFPQVGGVGNVRGDRRDFTRPPGAFTLWAILRDGRGGTDWVTVAVSAL